MPSSSPPSLAPSAQGVDSEIPEKLSFKIGEVARLVGVKPHVLRFWEGEFTRIRPAKGKNGHRLYTRSDIESLRNIRSLLHDRGYTIAGARTLYREGADAVDAAVRGQPSETAVALVSAEERVEVAEASLTEAQAQTQAMRRVAARAREEVDYWRTAAQTAERKLEALSRVVERETTAICAVLEQTSN